MSSEISSGWKVTSEKSNDELSSLTFSAGQDILQDEPYACCVDEIYLDIICSYCIKQKEPNACCPNCKRVNYCNDNCKENDRVLHDLECKVLRKAVPPACFPDSEIRLVVRAIDRAVRESRNEEESVGEFFGCRRSVYDLVTHMEHLSDDVLDNTKKRAHHIFDLIREHMVVRETDVRVMLQRCRINCHAIIEHDSPKRRVLGRAMYLAASKLNHSCLPMTDYVQIFDGRTYRLRAFNNIQITDPLALTINYVPSSRTLADRQFILERNYYFKCRCARCVSQIQQGHLLTAEKDDADLTREIIELLCLNRTRRSAEETYATCRRILRKLRHLPDNTFDVNQLLIRLQQASHEIGNFRASIRYGIRALKSNESVLGQQACLFYLCQSFANLGYNNESEHKHHRVFLETLKLTKHLYRITHGRQHRLVHILNGLQK
ncbi:SET and MYND domain-containing protein 1-like [Tropilaelaps mercedesae]|uniref:SET and MYND domain-containing protein 1-like n=1 Tax=Tropilaelaps mercedesae TaxID=418985 RepID=A0A1V9XRK9_9ACAR|nr:SET and MYND domain-containing protein 1-like [Tropilaelaps mercedesae]